MKWSRTARRSSVWVVAGTAVLAATTAAGPAGIATAAGPAGATSPVWRESVPPGAGVVVNSLVMPDATTLWAAATRVVQEGKGTRFEQTLFTTDAAAQGGWHEVALAPVAVRSRANAIDATCPDDALIVGDYDPSLGAVVTQRARDGVWTLAKARVPGHTMSGGLLQVDVRTQHDAWAVGWVQIDDGVVPDPDGGPSRQLSHDEPLVEHWNGSAWQRMTLPAVASSWALADVEALAPDDVWAVGQTDDSLQPVLMHYNGTAWSRTPTPRYGGLQGELLQLTARDGAVWAVGSVKSAQDVDPRGLVLRLNAGTWRAVPLPPGTRRLAAAASTATGIAAVGTDSGSSYGLLITPDGTKDLHLPDAGVSVTSVLAHGSALAVGGVRPATGPEPARPVVLTTG